MSERGQKDDEKGNSSTLPTNKLVTVQHGKSVAMEWSWPTLAKPTLANFSVSVFWPKFLVLLLLLCCCVVCVVVVVSLRGTHPSAPPFGGLTFSRFGPPTLRGPLRGRFGQSRPIKVGQSRSNFFWPKSVWPKSVSMEFMDVVDFSKNWKNIGDVSRVSLTGSVDSFANDGGCTANTAPRTCHTRKHFFACDS